MGRSRETLGIEVGELLARGLAGLPALWVITSLDVLYHFLIPLVPPLLSALKPLRLARSSVLCRL